MGLGCALHTHVLPCLRVPRASPRVTCSVARRSARESRFYISRFKSTLLAFFRYAHPTLRSIFSLTHGSSRARLPKIVKVG